MTVARALVDNDRPALSATLLLDQGWRCRALARHSVGTSLLLVLLAAAFVVLPGQTPGVWGAGLLLAGGALVGIPHGMTDFVVAHRLLARQAGAWWLPGFVVVYLLIVGGVLLGWAVAPLATLALFLVLSALHFGVSEDPASARRWPWVSFAARATTPLLPIFMLHAPVIAPYVATMTGRSAAQILATLNELRPVLIVPWGSFVVASVLAGAGRTSRSEPFIQAAEIGALALAAIVLPPLITFATFFCLIHAVRHLISLTEYYHPREPGQALRLAALVAAPAVVVCSVTLATLWSSLGGSTPTQRLLCDALQLLAALTAPHMALEFLDRRYAK